MRNTMKKKLTESQFLDAIDGQDLKAQTIEIARGVLVDGRPQTYFIELLRLSNGAVSQAVNRVWKAHEAKENKLEYVSAMLPKHQAYIVRTWEKGIKKKLGQIK